MKTINFKLGLILIAAFGLMFNFSSCDGTTSDTEGVIHITFANSFDTVSLTYNDTLVNVTSNRKFTFTRSNFYISNIRFMDDAGGLVHSIDEHFLIKNGEVNEFIANAPIGHYHMMMFDVGVQETENHEDPSLRTAPDVLANQSPSMHWSWASGYKFVVLEGEADTSSTPDGTLDANWIYHIGMDSLKASVSIALHSDVEASKESAWTIVADHNKILDGVDVGGQDLDTHTMNNMPLAVKIRDNFANAFKLSESGHHHGG